MFQAPGVTLLKAAEWLVFSREWRWDWDWDNLVCSVNLFGPKKWNPVMLN